MNSARLGRYVIVVVGVIAIVLGVGVPASAGVPTEQLRPAMDEVLRIVNDPHLKELELRQPRRLAIRRVMEDIVDFPDAARRALGPHWRERTDAERAEFVGLFRELVILSCTASIDLFSGEKVIYLAEAIDEGMATIRTKIVRRERADVPVDYRMHEVGARWLVYDVTVEGASLVANYRAQFHAIIKTASYGELVKRIRARLSELSAPAPLAAR
jgi:phospholipid transport system substrate-binding protein